MPRKVETMTKEDIIHEVRKSNCKMMFGLPLLAMSKDELIAHLKKSCCPVLKKLTQEK